MTKIVLRQLRIGDKFNLIGGLPGSKMYRKLKLRQRQVRSGKTNAENLQTGEYVYIEEDVEVFPEYRYYAQFNKQEPVTTKPIYRQYMTIAPMLIYKQIALDIGAGSSTSTANLGFKQAIAASASASSNTSNANDLDNRCPVWTNVATSSWSDWVNCLSYTINDNSGLSYNSTANYLGSLVVQNNKWSQPVMAENGKIYCPPYNHSQILVIDPATDGLSLAGSFTTVGLKWQNGVLAPNGKIYCPARRITGTLGLVLKIDPDTDTGTTLGAAIPLQTGTNKYGSGSLAPNGYIYAPQLDGSYILKIDPTTDTWSEFDSGQPTSILRYFSSVLAPNGKIYCIPTTAGTVQVIDPDTDTVSTFGSFSTTNQYFSGVLAPNGKIYCPNYTVGAPILVIDTNNDTVSFINTPATNTGQSSGAVLAHNGKIYTIPFSATYINEIDYTNDTVVNTFTTITGSATQKYNGGRLAKNGYIYMSPAANTSVAKFLPVDSPNSYFTNDALLTGFWNRG